MLIEQTLCHAVGGEVLRRDDAKNAKLRANRGIGFEDVVLHIERVDLLDILEHPNPDRYAEPTESPAESRKQADGIPSVDLSKLGVGETERLEIAQVRSNTIRRGEWEVRSEQDLLGRHELQ